MTKSFNQYIAAFSQAEHLSSLTGISRGIERETLRIEPEGKLSFTSHLPQLGAALTHPMITTDYAENLLEFITPVSQDAQTAISQLQDIQKFSYQQLDRQLFWPMSMPCFVDDAEQIPLAQYGQSNIGKMKTVYRQGLKNRYGSMMQVIAGIHFNFSFSEQFWCSLQQISDNDQPFSDFISARYFALLRNYKRYCWLIPYLYGSSPAVCSSFLQNKTPKLPFERTPKGLCYLPYATSLRMSDLGYTNSAQAALQISYNDIDSYVASVKNAISLSSDKFAEIGVKVDGQYQQLNANILQIENELYAPIRPKRVANSGEKPSEALARAGVEYIEVRALDVNPFVDTGISLEQIHFLDVFLTFCALSPESTLPCNEQKVYESNMEEVVLRGRDPELLLNDSCQKKSVKQWGNELFDQMERVAELLDSAYKTEVYQRAVNNERVKINDPDATPSAKVLDMALNGEGMTAMAMSLAKKYRDDALTRPYQFFNHQQLLDIAEQSHQKQQEIEQADELSFDQFLTEYFTAR